MKRILLCAILAAVLTISLAVGASALGEEMIIATGTPKIDGVIDDIWATADRQQLGYCKAGDRKVDAYTLPEDCSVYASALYDNTALYFLFEITDNEFAFDSSVGDWKNDAIYLYIDEIGDGDPTWTDQQAQIALIPEDGWELIPRKGATPADYELAYTFPTATTCVIEFKYVPRELALKEGTEFTLDFQYNDSIPGGTRDYCLGWSDETDDASNNSSCWGFATLGGAGTASAPAAAGTPGNWTNTNFTASFDDPDWHSSSDDIEFEDTWVAGESNARCNDGSYYVYLKNDGLGDYSVEFEVKEDGTYEVAICLMAWEKSVPRATNVKVDDSDWVRLEFDYENEDKQLEQFITGLTIPLTKGTHKLTLGLPDGHDDSTLKTLYFDYFFLRKVGDMGAAPAAASSAELLAKSFDTIFVDGEMMVDGSANVWLADNPVEGDIVQLEVRGWTHISTPIQGYAYTIDGGAAVKSEDFIQDRPDVKAVIHEEAEGFDIAIDVSEVGAGDHVIKIFAIDENGGLVDSTFEFPFTQTGGASAAAPASGYPASGESGNFMMGKIIGNETGWDGTAGSGAASAFDGKAETFFDPLGVGDGFCGMEFDEPYILEKVAILSRSTFLDRFYGGSIEGSNDGEEWETLWESEEEAPSATEYNIVTEFDNNYGYKMFRYINWLKHGDVAEVEFYGKPGTAERPAEEPKAEEPKAEEPKAEEPKAEEPAAEPEPETPAETPAETPTETPAEKPAETAKSGCGSMIGGGMIVLVTILGSAWISKRR